jgi:hypothetical protein
MQAQAGLGFGMSGLVSWFRLLAIEDSKMAHAVLFRVKATGHTYIYMRIHVA